MEISLTSTRAIALKHSKRLQTGMLVPEACRYHRLRATCHMPMRRGVEQHGTPAMFVCKHVAEAVRALLMWRRDNLQECR